MNIFQSAAFWALAAVVVVLIGGLVTGFLYHEPEKKPTLAAQKKETEADIKEEFEDKEKRGEVYEHAGKR